MSGQQNGDTRRSADFLGKTVADHEVSPNDAPFVDTALSRREFFRRFGKSSTALAFLSACGAGTDAVANGLFGRGLLPVVWADEADLLAQKPDMLVHNTQPINGEFLPHLLNAAITPTTRHFVRNNGSVPDRAQKQDLQGWKLVVDGEVHTPLALSFDGLKQLPAVTYQALIECGGNGRALFDPAVRGNPWGRGAIACSQWTGVRLRDVLNKAGLKSSAVYTAHYGEDIPLGKAEPFSRGIPIDKAMDEHTLIAYQMNGQDIPALNGYPVRLLVPGWIGSASQKWLSRIWVRDTVHDSQKMTGFSYRVPAYPVAPGAKPPEEDMIIATAWIVKSLITNPEAESSFSLGQAVKVQGHAWAGEETVQKVLVSTDFGISWKEAALSPAANRYAWVHWQTELSFANKGYYEIWARAFDDQGNAQPFRQPWNPKGYLGNVIHRIPVSITA